MASSHIRLPSRRLLAQRGKVDENANSKHARQSSITGASRITGKENIIKAPPTRTALGEVTLSAVNRKDAGKNSLLKDKEETNLKRARSTSVAAPQRVPLGPSRGQISQPVATAVHARPSVARHQIHIPSSSRRNSRTLPEPVVLQEEEVHEDEPSHEMDVEDDNTHESEQLIDLHQEREVEAMVGIEEDDEEEDVEEQDPVDGKSAKVWPDMDTALLDKCQKKVEALRETYEDVINMYDTAMASEYADDIFEYMANLEENAMPNPNYMAGQTEINWGMRQTLVDWLLQVHLRYHMLPETLWIAVNIVDRFLTKRVVSVSKLQLVGVTAMLIAAKYEEILAPSVDEFVYITHNTYTKDEILKGERIILQTLDFQISNYCSPYSWMRKISKADDYELRTRTLGKFLAEVTLLDHRFLRAKPSLVAAVGMYSARKLLGGDWNDGFVFQSGYTAEQLDTGHQWLMEKLLEPSFLKTYVCKKYANRKFLKASVFAVDWARSHMLENFPENYREYFAAALS
ncbi:cyclin [Amanita rubescens]|nr:cyclin [Amanita rubescens]